MCPYCGKVIGGHVQAGTEAYYRVSKGQCPHCGRSMPYGHKVDFLTSSGEFASDARKRAEFQTKQREARKKKIVIELANAHSSHKKVGFHAAFGALGLFWMVFCSIGVQNGQFVFVTHGAKESVFPIAVATIAGAAYWLLLHSASYTHYKKHIMGNEGKTVIAHNLEKALDKDGMMTWIFTVLSWFLFGVACVFFIGVVFQK